MFKAITAIPNVVDLRTGSSRSRFDILRVNIDDSPQVFPRSSPAIPKDYSYNKQMDEAKSQRAIRSIGYRKRHKEYPCIKRPNKCSLEFVRRSYLDDH
jgi:hypothetical protein